MSDLRAQLEKKVAEWEEARNKINSLHTRMDDLEEEEVEIRRALFAEEATPLIATFKWGIGTLGDGCTLMTRGADSWADNSEEYEAAVNLEKLCGLVNDRGFLKVSDDLTVWFGHDDIQLQFSSVEAARTFMAERGLLNRIDPSALKSHLLRMRNRLEQSQREVDSIEKLLATLLEDPPKDSTSA